MSSRKSDHITMSFSSVPDHQIKTPNVYYEPLLSAHPTNHENIKQKFLGYSFEVPLWVSSMTGGTEKAKHINQNLAKACGAFKMGMGLGSCRPLLENNDRFEDFNVKHLMPESPLFTNFGIAQIEELIDCDALNKVQDITEKLQADGLVIHVNPLQEWAQPEGDRYKRPAIETIETVCNTIGLPIIVKEVGQGMGPKSLEAIFKLPISAIELAGYGGTNFSILEQRRQYGDEIVERTPYSPFGYVGCTAEEMIDDLNRLNLIYKRDIEVIISGGIKDVITGHMLKEKLQINSIVGMASTMLKYAMQDYEVLEKYIEDTRECFSMAKAFLLKSEHNE